MRTATYGGIAMKYCIYCGQKLEDHAEYCSKCGKKQSGKNTVTPDNKTNSRSDVELIRKYLKGASEIEWNLYGKNQIKEGLLAQLNSQLNQESLLKRQVRDKKDWNTRTENEIRNAKPEEYRKSAFSGFEIGYDSEFYVLVSFGFWIACAILVFFKIGPFPALTDRLLDWLSVVKFGQVIAVVGIVILPTLFVFACQLVYGLIRLLLHNTKESGRRAEFEREAQQKLESRKRRLRQEISERNNSIKADENKISRIHNTVIPALEKEIANCNDEIDKAEKKRSSYYSVNVLYPKYQALIPVCTMYEYFDSGRVDTLTGHEGAYNLYENELHLKIIVSKLTEISEKLDRISANQQAILSRLNSLNSRVNGLMNSVEKANQNYISSTASVTSQLNQLQYSTDLNNYYAKENTLLLQRLKEIKKADYQSHTFY